MNRYFFLEGIYILINERMFNIMNNLEKFKYKNKLCFYVY